MAAVATKGAIGPSQVFTTPKGNALQTPTYNGVRNARKIGNFFWKLEAYFGVMDEIQKVHIASFSLKGITLVWWRRRGDDVK